MYQRINGASLWVEQLSFAKEQNRPTLVFLHEGLGSVESWRQFPETLCRALEMDGILYDRVGYGKSSPLNEPRQVGYLEEEALVYLPQLLEKRRVNDPILIGHSDGGSIALLYAAHHPHTVGILTEAAHVKVEAATTKGIKQALAQAAETQLLEKMQRYHGSKAALLLQSWGDIWLSEAFQQWNIEAFLPQIQCPALVIQGEADEFASPQHLYDIVSGIGPKAESLLLPGCHHTPHRHSEERVLAEMKRFIERLL